MKECERIIQSLEHFYGHLEITPAGHLGLCRLEKREDVFPEMQEIADFCRMILSDNKHDPQGAMKE